MYNDYNILSTYYVVGMVLSILYVELHLIPTKVRDFSFFFTVRNLRLIKVH